jgi:hypothetical protein
MPKTKSVDTTPHEKFTKALASVLSASPEQVQESRAQAKAEKPSSHTRCTYAPERGPVLELFNRAFPVNST